MAKIVVACPTAQRAIQLFLNHGFTVSLLADSSGQALTAEITDAEAILAEHVVLTPDLLDISAKLKVIGYCSVDSGSPLEQELIGSRGIKVVSARPENSLAQAEQALALMLALAKNLPQVFLKSNGQDQLSGAIQLEGKTLALFGLEASGRILARKALRGLGMRVIAFDFNAQANEPGIVIYSDWRAMLAEADILSIHMMLSDSNRGLLDFAAMQLLKPSAFLISCCQGGIVDEPDLALALNQGLLAGAGLDVFYPQPLGPDHPLWDLPQVILTPQASLVAPHDVAAMAEQTALRIIELLAR